jgi:tryptophan halogenase
MFKEVDNVVIVGGGTSAWFTAAFLARNLDVKVTLVDKEVGSPVGVGEGTLLHFDKFLKRCGFNTDEWFDEIDATFKSGILFPNWGKKDNLVWHPFYLNKEYQELESSIYEAWTHHQDHDFQGLQAYFNLSIENNVDTENLNYYASHVDASKLVQWLQKRLKDHITIIKSEMVNINRDDNGYVQSIDLKDGQNIKGDLFVDCTGFRQLLQDAPDRVDLTGRLFCDTAVAGHVPYENIETERQPYVVSEAVDHGWVWNIPVQTRIGSGLVFNRSITDPEDAKKYFCEYWDNRISPENLKVIDWTPYYNRNQWSKNVCAIGLSAGFIEPLESTGLATITTGIYLLALRIRQKYFTEADINMYNAIMAATYEDTIDFINMHYAYTEFDTPFWNWVKETHVMNETHKWYKGLIASGERLPNDGKGHFFGGANWLCWLLQIEENIAPTKNISSETAKQILDDWQSQMDYSVVKQGTIPHAEAIANYALYLNMSMDPQELEWDR